MVPAKTEEETEEENSLFFAEEELEETEVEEFFFAEEELEELEELEEWTEELFFAEEELEELGEWTEELFFAEEELEADAEKIGVGEHPTAFFAPNSASSFVSQKTVPSLFFILVLSPRLIAA